MPRPSPIVALPVLLLACACVQAGDTGSDRERSTQIGGTAEKPITMTLEASPHTRYCHARIAIEYTQRNTVASITGAIENDDCHASSGTYRLVVKIRDNDGATSSLEKEEAWERGDDQPFRFAHEIAIGQDVDLVTVRARMGRCVCADVDAEADPAEQDSPPQ